MLFTGLDRSVLRETVPSVWVLSTQALGHSFSQYGPPSQWITYIYYIHCVHTEKYVHSPKSYVVNFHTQTNSTQSEEWTMVFTFFFFFSRMRKMIMSNQKPTRCVSFAPKFTPFICACSLQRPLQHWWAVFQRDKSLTCAIKKHNLWARYFTSWQHYGWRLDCKPS